MYNSYKKNIHIGPSFSIYMANIFCSATTEEKNLEKYIIHTPENIHFSPSSIIYMSNIFCSIKILK